MKGFFLALSLTLFLFVVIAGFFAVDYNTNKTGFDQKHQSVAERAAAIEIDTELAVNQLIVFVPSKLRILADGAVRIKTIFGDTYKKLKNIIFDQKKKSLGDSLFLKKNVAF